MERYDVDAMRAFEMLRELSQTSNTRLVDIADRVIATGASSRRYSWLSSGGPHRSRMSARG